MVALWLRAIPMASGHVEYHWSWDCALAHDPDPYKTVTLRKLHAIFLLVSIPALGCLGAFLLHVLRRNGTIEIQALAWATSTAGLHAAFGWRLWKQHLQVGHSGIASGVKILAVRFFTGVGLFVTGLVMNPQAKEVFTTMWTGIFLILFVSESIFFFKGVQEL